MRCQLLGGLAEEEVGDKSDGGSDSNDSPSTGRGHNDNDRPHGEREAGYYITRPLTADMPRAYYCLTSASVS